jgi:hypothetical protein
MLWNNGRRVLVPPVGWANMLATACAQRDARTAALAASERENSELRQKNDALRQELGELEHLRELLRAQRATDTAEVHLAELQLEHHKAQRLRLH